MSRNITFSVASAVCCTTSAVCERTAVLQLDEQAMCQDLLAELSYSLSGRPKELHNCAGQVTTSVHPSESRVISNGVLSRASVVWICT